MTNTIITSLIGVLCTIITAVTTTILIPSLSKWLKSKTNNEILKGVIDDITQTVQTSVGMFEQTMVKQLKADGKWNAESQSMVLRAAVQETVSNLSSKTIKALNDEKSDVNELIIRYIESYIYSQKFPSMEIIND